jgi:hypothetical protein
MLKEPFKATAPSRTGVGYLGQRRTQLCPRPFTYFEQMLAQALRTNMESVSNGAMNILSPDSCYSL